MKSLNENKAKELATRWKAKGLPYNAIYDTAIEVMQWKDEQYKEREEGLLETINALETKLQKTKETGLYYLDKYNVQKQQLIEKACKYLKSYRQDTPDGLGYFAGIVNDKTIEDFKKYMKGK